MNQVNTPFLKVGQLWQAAKGTSEKYDIELSESISDDLILEKPIKLSLELIKMKDSIVALGHNLETAVTLDCNRCLIKFKEMIEADSFEREFLMNPKERDYDPSEHFLIDSKDLTIDLSDMLRQEIILHFPINPVCSTRCKGLCPQCGSNLNNGGKHKKDCQRKNLDADDGKTHRPFANLKDLIK